MTVEDLQNLITNSGFNPEIRVIGITPILYDISMIKMSITYNKNSSVHNNLSFFIIILYHMWRYSSMSVF